MKKLLAVALILLFASCASATTYYVSYSSGSNSNNGTSESTPWKTAPYMNHSSGCDGGTGPTYTHSAGDKFVFEGGDTWPNACFTMILTAGGTSSSYDYYGVCWSTDADSPCSGRTSWPSTGWTRPIFDAGGAAMTGASNNFIYVSSVSVGYFTVDNIEMKNQLGTASSDPCHDAAIEMVSNSGTQEYFENLYLHEFWIALATLQASGGYGGAEGGLCMYNGGDATATNITATDVDGGLTGTTAGTVPLLSCFYNINIVENSTCEYYADGILGGTANHDNLFAYGSDAIQSYTSNHSNDIEDTWQTGMAVYNTVIHDSNTGQHIAVAPGGAVFNDVMWNIGNGPGDVGVDNGIDTTQSYPSAYTYFYNNTLSCANIDCINVHQRSSLSLGTVTIENNIFYSVTNSSGIAIYNPTSYPTTESNNYQMPASEGNTYGLTPANFFKPTSTDSNISGQALNLTSSCTGALAALCQDASGAFWFGSSPVTRPTSGGWDTGAYQGAGSGGSGPPTAAITAPTSGATISGSSVTLTATCTPQGSATVSSIQFTIDGLTFDSAGTSSPYSITLDSTLVGNGTHTINAACTDSNGQVGSAPQISATVSNSTPGCFTSTSTGATNLTVESQAITAQTSTFTITWTETVNSTGTNDTVAGVSNGVPTTWSSFSSLVLTGPSYWEAYNGNSGYQVSSVSDASGTYTLSMTVNPVAGTYSATVNGTTVAANYSFRAAATSLDYFGVISDAGVYDTVKVCNVSISGGGPTTSLGFSPSSLAFGNVVVSTPTTLTITASASGGTVNVTTVAVSGSADAAKGTDTCQGNAITTTCTTQVTVTPSATGAGSAVVTYTDDATGSPQTVNVTWNGVSASGVVACAPISTLNFGGVQLFATGVPGPVVCNVTGSAVTFSTAAISGTYADEYTKTADTCSGNKIQPNSSCSLNFSFTPHQNAQSGAAATATLTITSDASNSPQTITLSGSPQPAAGGVPFP